MTVRLGLAVAAAGVAVILTGSLTPKVKAAVLPADTERTVLFSAVDSKGVPIKDMTAADLVVKENGKERAIASVKPATDPFQIFLIVDDGGTGAFQAPVAQFLQTMFGKAQFGLSLLNPQPIRITDLTDDANALRTAVGRLGQRGRITPDGEQIIGSVSDAARALSAKKAAHPVIVVLTVSGEPAGSPRSQEALNDVKAANAILHVVFITGTETGQLLGDGPKQTGGVSLPASTGVAIGPTLARVTDSLLNQYLLTYTLPDGVKPNEKFQLSTSRKGVTLLAPTRVPEK